MKNTTPPKTRAALSHGQDHQKICLDRKHTWLLLPPLCFWDCFTYSFRNSFYLLSLLGEGLLGMLYWGVLRSILGLIWTEQYSCLILSRSLAREAICRMELLMLRHGHPSLWPPFQSAMQAPVGAQVEVNATDISLLRGVEFWLHDHLCQKAFCVWIILALLV